MAEFPGNPNYITSQLPSNGFHYNDGSERTTAFCGCNSWDDLSEWSWEEHDAIERALFTVPEDDPNRWQIIAGVIPGRSPAEVFIYCTALLQDVDTTLCQIEKLPDSAVVDPPHQLPEQNNGDKNRVKRQSWTDGEHILFIKGLKKYGKGDWKGIAKFMGNTKRSSQVASHAQKYFLRQAQNKKQRSNRSSIHDITTLDDDDDNHDDKMLAGSSHRNQL